MATDQPGGDERAIPVLGIVCASLLPVAALFSVGKWFKGWLLDLGSFALPTPVHTYFLFFYTLLGAVSVAGLTLGFAGLLGRRDRWSRLTSACRRVPDRWWMIGAALLAFAIPLFVRLFVLEGARLTDDEEAYLFMARLLGDGQLTAAAHPAHEFFDRFAMVVDDGRVYSQYFLGWPALLGPFAWLGIPGAANPVYSAVTAVGLFLLTRRLIDSDAARAATALYVLSPFAMAMAGTLLSHTVCLGWLVWTMWAMARSFEERPPAWVDPLVAICFSGAFFTRPTVAVGIGGPCLIAWLVHLVRHRSSIVRPLVTFALPAAALAVLFLTIIHLQTGSAFTTPYEVSYQYRIEHLGGAVEGREVPNMEFTRPGNALALTTMALVRFNYAAWGWLSALLFVPLACAAPRRRWLTVLWATLAGFLLVHFPMTDSGVDSFGPVHYFELLLPVLLLTVVGLRVAVRWASRRAGPATRWLPVRTEILPAALVAALVYASLVMYVPVRWANLGWLADRHNEPRRAVERAGVDRAVVFGDSLFIKCARHPNGFVGWPPLNSPELDDPVLWANHLTLERDRAFMRYHFPERRGYLLSWDEHCRASLVPLDQLEPDQVRPGQMAEE